MGRDTFTRMLSSIYYWKEPFWPNKYFLLNRKFVLTISYFCLGNLSHNKFSLVQNAEGLYRLVSAWRRWLLFKAFSFPALFSVTESLCWRCQHWTLKGQLAFTSPMFLYNKDIWLCMLKFWQDFTGKKKGSQQWEIKIATKTWFRNGIFKWRYVQEIIM